MPRRRQPVACVMLPSALRLMTIAVGGQPILSRWGVTYPMRTPSIDAGHQLAFGPRPICPLRLAYVIIIHVGAACAFLPGTFSVAALVTAFGLHFVTGCLGVSIGLHRSLTHGSVKLPLSLERAFIFLAVLDVQKPITWVAIHRLHHKYSGTDLDPHNANRGFVWSHLGWLLRSPPTGFDPASRASDIARDPFYRFLESNFLIIFIMSLILLYLVGGVPFLIWAGFVRLVVVAHSTWAIDSFGHLCGYQNYEQPDGYNNRLLSFLTYGEGLHNNHHHSQRASNFAHKKGEIDLSRQVIEGLRLLHLAQSTERTREDFTERT
jgi:fatty-acid desaturase